MRENEVTPHFICSSSNWPPAAEAVRARALTASTSGNSVVPELPEVETTLRGISPFLQQQRIESVSVRNGNLRWPVPADISSRLRGHTVLRVRRRGKYLLIDFSHGSAVIHL